ncbi:aconitase [Marinobacterium zhoushanense]|uniref:Aconitase n=1 Tax=Marinobacterium zhoushanense TaxID=1679163 RepID=A0ABQ1KM49_9GAMM|nr:IucA/IucC family protein [Marinobacterium zhoushanense]GGC04601.1 aconitase [Marinobacterium zhoushanense]
MNAPNLSLQRLVPSSDTTTAQARAEAEAERSCIRNLLNCYLREVARPRGHLHEQPAPELRQTLPLGWRHSHSLRHWLMLQLPHTGRQLMIAVSRPSTTGNYRYALPVLARHIDGGPAAWQPIGALQLARALIDDLSRAEGVAFNLELLQQIEQSLAVTRDILADTAHRAELHDADELYRYSEQSLAFGHPFHPAPKCRQWGEPVNEADYAPEYRGTLQLHWFGVAAALLRVETVAPLTPEQLLADIAQDAPPSKRVAIPVHPMQARYLLGLPAIRRALAEGLIEDLGQGGEPYAPTASVRTLYHPQRRWFLKGSLNIRITNCVRKNAIYELESALAIQRRLQPLQAELSERFPGFRLLGEPGFLTLELPDCDADSDKAVQEGFGLIVRENVHAALVRGEQAILAGALFQEGAPLANRLPVADPRLWLRGYAEALIPPMLDAFFRHGLIFEPHLQNTLICLHKGYPSGVAVRDFEGVKLVEEQWPPERTADLGPRARQSVLYSEAQGWNRVRYCLFINNLAEAVHYLCNDSAQLEAELWRTIAQVIRGYRDQCDLPRAHALLDPLLDGEPLPSKTNLLVRFHKHADRLAGYVPVASPFDAKPVKPETGV